MPLVKNFRAICSLLLALLFVITASQSCRKKEVARPTQVSNDTTTTAPLILPTKEIEGEYVWHASDTASGSVYSDGIEVLNDTVIVLTSDVRYYNAWGGMGKYYHYSSKNDSEVVYGDAPYTITYKFKRGLIHLLKGTSEYTAVVGASARWKSSHDDRIGALRNWHRTHHYYVYNNELKDTIVVLPDTLADAFGLVGYPSIYTSDGLKFSGADSTHAFYDEYRFGAGPYKLTHTISLEYHANGDTIEMYLTSPGAFATTRSYTSF
ncbi:MAG: hypothetical protein KF744_04395 [Taibaiella sp.]|nr:hypothetical protein [Taibaiella sp.]